MFCLKDYLNVRILILILLPLWYASLYFVLSFVEWLDWFGIGFIDVERFSTLFSLFWLIVLSSLIMAAVRTSRLFYQDVFVRFGRADALIEKDSDGEYFVKSEHAEVFHKHYVFVAKQTCLKFWLLFVFYCICSVAIYNCFDVVRYDGTFDHLYRGFSILPMTFLLYFGSFAHLVDVSFIGHFGKIPVR